MQNKSKKYNNKNKKKKQGKTVQILIGKGKAGKIFKIKISNRVNRSALVRREG